MLKFNKPNRRIAVIAIAIAAVAFATALTVGFAANRTSGTPSSVLTLYENPQNMFHALSQYLPEAAAEQFPNFKESEMDEGGVLWLWSKWDNDNDMLAHKIEVVINEDAITHYSYKNYYVIPPENSISLEQANRLVKGFARDFIPNGNTLLFENTPVKNNIYDPGKVESWIADRDGLLYVITVNLEHGYVQRLSVEQFNIQQFGSSSFSSSAA
jgi:hypothetical protein